MSSKTNSGIQTATDGSSFVPASKRADGSVRKEIKVRPGFKPSEDIATYKTPTVAAFKNRGSTGVPGAEPTMPSTDADSKSKNAKRREAARKKAAAATQDEDLAASMVDAKLLDADKLNADWRDRSKLATSENTAEDEAERQKKTRNTLKKLKAVRELKEKKLAGERLSPDQLMKIGKEGELVLDLKKLGYEDAELAHTGENKVTDANGELSHTQGG